MQDIENTEIVCKQLFTAALRAASPAAAVREHSAALLTTYRGSGCERIILLGFGKAAPAMAGATIDLLGDRVDAGVIITKYGHNFPSLPGAIKVFEAGHPVPDDNGLRGTEELIALARQADSRTLAVTLISGGGSALLVSPQDGLTLQDKQLATNLLLKAGADIFELNTVRKHLSKVKGGRLAQIVFPARMVSLILSDVIGDRLDVIASGPTAADPTTYDEALAVLSRYHLSEKMPGPVIDLLSRGARGDFPETPKADSRYLHNTENIIIGSNRQALAAAAGRAESLGFAVKILAEDQTGEARDAGRQLALKALTEATSKASGERICLLGGGETTVTVRGTGTGGRNMELALAFAMAIEGYPGITLLSAGTDGTDGPTDATGAIVDGSTVPRARGLGLDPQDYLDSNDSYTFFDRAGGLLKTGPTGTNVMDLQIVVLT